MNLPARPKADCFPAPRTGPRGRRWGTLRSERGYRFRAEGWREQADADRALAGLARLSQADARADRHEPPGHRCRLREDAAEHRGAARPQHPPTGSPGSLLRARCSGSPAGLGLLERSAPNTGLTGEHRVSQAVTAEVSVRRVLRERRDPRSRTRRRSSGRDLREAHRRRHLVARRVPLSEPARRPDARFGVPAATASAAPAASFLRGLVLHFLASQSQIGEDWDPRPMG